MGMALALVVLRVHLLACAAAGTTTISNLKPRLSTTGEIVNAHDGTVRRIDGVYWMHAAQYGECADPPHHGCEMTGSTRATSCGFEPNHNVSIWRSANLSSGSWEFVGQAVQCADLEACGILYRPHMVYNPTTKLYVLYWNYVNKKGAYAGNGAATATSPAGPFEVATPLVNTTYATGDFDVFVDPATGVGYMIYSQFHLMFIEQLSPDMLHGTGIGADIPGGTPAPAPPPSPPPLPLHCPAGQHVDAVELDGDNGSCDCDEFCGSDWPQTLKTVRSHWKGAASAYPGAKTNCVCVQASHWCPKGSGVGCGATCSKVGTPVPQDYCVPGDPPAPPPAPAAKALVAFPVPFVEAPALFLRKGIYYAVFGHCCCFCYQGSGMFVFTAPHPLGPWKQQGPAWSEPGSDLGCTANATTPTPAEQHTLPLTAFPQPGQGCIYNGARAASVSRAQQNFIVEVATASGETEFIWTGDRWMQAPDGIKGHEPQYWDRLKFDEAGRILPMVWHDELVLDLA